MPTGGRRPGPDYLRRSVYVPYSDIVPVSPADSGVATVMPVTPGQVKQQARVETDAEDDLIELHLQAAVDGIQRATGRFLGQVAIDAYLPCLDYGQLAYLPGGRVQSVTEIAYRDEDGVEQAWESDNYELQAFPVYSSVRLVNGAALFPPTWILSKDRQAVRIRYIAGHATVDEIPVGLRQAVLMMAAGLYIEREAHRTQPGVIAIANPAAEMLIRAHKIHWPV